MVEEKIEGKTNRRSEEKLPRDQKNMEDQLGTRQCVDDCKL